MAVKILALLLGVASAVASWYILDDEATLVDLVLPTLWFFAPWAAVAWLPARDAERLVAVAGCAALSVWAFLAAHDSSTGPLVFLFLPVYMAAIFGLAAAGGALVRLAARRL